MSDERYRRRRDQDFAAESDYPRNTRQDEYGNRTPPREDPNVQRDVQRYAQGDTRQQDAQHRNSYNEYDAHDGYSDHRNDTSRSSEGYHSAANNHHEPQPPHDHRAPRAYRDDDRRRDDYREHSPHENPEREIRQRGVIYPVRFHGKTSEYFKIWIVNVLLTIVTLYIYSAWAKVRTTRYFYGNTTVDNSSFEYHASGRQLVVGRLVAAALLIIYTFFQGVSMTIAMAALGILVVMFPWAIWRSLRFGAKASSYRNIRFGFEGQATLPYVNIVIIPLVILGLIGVTTYALSSLSGTKNLQILPSLSIPVSAAMTGGILIAVFLVLTLVVPLLHKNLISYSLNNHRYGTAQFSAKVPTGRVYTTHLLTLLLSILAMVVFGVLLFGLFNLLLESLDLLDNSEILTKLEPYANMISGAIVYIIAIPITGIAVAFFRSRIRNLRYNSTIIGSRVLLESTTTTWSLWCLNIGNLALLILSLGLAYPFTKIRSARYFAEHTNVIVQGGLDSFTEQEKTRLNAMGEEMADAFDVEFDIGI